MSSSLYKPVNAAERGVLSRLLAKLKAREVKNCTPEESELLARLLLSKSQDSSSSHWYCHRAPELTREAAGYCQQWLVATDSQAESVVRWTRRHQEILDTCVDCVKSMEDALLASQFTYLGSVKKEKMERYFQAYADWNATRLLERLGATETMDQLHPAQSYHIFYNPAITGHITIWPVLEEKLPSATIKGWPEMAPAGVIPLLFLPSEASKEWANLQLEDMKLPPEVALPAEDNYYKRTYDGIMTALASTAGPNMDIAAPYVFRCIFNGSASAPFWASFPAVLRRYPDMVSSSIIVVDEKLGDVGRRTNLVGILVNHLSRYDEAFPFVLETFEATLQLFGADAWRKKNPQLPKIALDGIKDNKAFLSMNAYKSGAEARLLGWLEPLVKSVMHLATYSEIIHRIFQIFLEQLQHESMRSVRPIFLTYFFSALTRIHRLPIDNDFDHRAAIIDATNIHSSVIIATALRKDFSGSEWKAARRYARAFLLELLDHDIEQIHAVLVAVTTLEADKTAVPPQISSSYGVLWEAVQSALRPDDVDGCDFFLQAVAKSALLSPMELSTLSPKIDAQTRPKVENLLKTVNRAISTIHKGFDGIILRFVDAISETDVASFCDRTGVTTLLITLLLSPIKALSEGAQTLIGQAYNADGRSECIRVLLEKQCDATLVAMVSKMKAFNKISTEYPHVVDAARILVVCYTDILDVMCAIDGGLLFSEKFKIHNKASLKNLPPLWKGMCDAAGIIIERTPEWATRYHSGDMTPWMRDALIFANELVDKRRVFESTLAESSTNSDDANLVENLSAIMRPLVSWLRLTHQELLDLSYKLLMDLFDAFTETNKQPEETLLQGLQRVIKKLEGKGVNQKSDAPVRTKLSVAQLGTLLRRIETLNGQEDSDIEFVSQSFSPKKVSIPPASRPVAPVQKAAQHFVISKAFKAQPSKSLQATSSKVKPGKLAQKLQEGALGSVTSLGLNTQMVQSAIAERKAAKANTSAVSLASSSGNEPMSSSSESDSEEDGAPSGLAQLSKLQRSPIKQQRHEKRRAILLTDAITLPRTGQINPTAATERQRQVQKQQIRYIPDMAPLHRIILGWNYDHDGPEPQTTGGPLNLKAVPNSFSSYRQYLDVMHPLFIVECWNSLLKSKEDSLDKVELIIAGKMHTDFWVEVDAVIDQSVAKGWMLLETDIILMEHAAGRKMLAKVHSARQTRQGIQATIRYSAELGDMDLERTMTIKSSWLVSRVFNLSTAHREYAALMGMHHYDWADAVYEAQIGTPVIPAEPQIQKAMQAHKLNHPQAKAVISTLQTPGFSLIQGPPGTGKTSTICGLVGVFLSTRRNPVTLVQVGKPGNKAAIPRKALVCAPSNAAIDEVAKRLKDGVWMSDGSKVVPNVVRLGADSSINVSVKDISLDQLVEERMSKTNSKHSEAATEIAGLRNELARVKQSRQEKTEEMQSSNTNSARIMQLEQDLRDLSSRRILLSSRLTAAQDMGKEAARAVDSARRKARLEVLNDADIVCCTLSGSGHDIIEQFEFDLVVIDEAAQAIELSSLIPLKFSSNRCIMVGDPQQLPPTVISQTATRLKYNQSLFVRLQLSNPAHVHLLSIQYRMHPEISRLPSALFYDGKLIDGLDMQQKTRQPWHSNDALGIFKFFEVRGQETQAESGHSQYNIAEVNVAAALYAKLRREYPNVNLDYRIGIISMYRAQLTKLRNEFSSRWGRDILSKIDFNTVDGFQGQEKDIIILSCVRAGTSITNIGFLADARRVNVAITRSRSSLFILGNASTLKRSNQLWEKIVNDARSRELLVSADPSYFTSSNPIVRPKMPEEPLANTLTTVSPKRVAGSAQLSKGMKSLTPKEWKAMNDQKRANILDHQMTGYNEQKVGAINPSPRVTVVAQPASSSRKERQISVPAIKASPPNSRKRELSDPEQSAQLPPSLRHTASTSVESTSNQRTTIGSSNFMAGQPKPPQRLPPKPKAASLFIPKKPPAKRPLPSDAPMPDPKRRPM